jgi:hypothetical protein
MGGLIGKSMFGLKLSLSQLSHLELAVFTNHHPPRMSRAKRFPQDDAANQACFHGISMNGELS